MAIYKGFSTEKWLSSRGNTFALSDVEIVKRDILNHIYTAPGDRVGMPKWGTRIPLMVFEQNDEITRKIIYDDLMMVAQYDPRVRLIDLKVVSLKDNNAIVAFMDLLYIEFNVQDTLHIEVQVGSV
jgi:phage baseplate assembly protein W